MEFTEILNLIQRNTNTQSNSTSSYPIADKTLDINNALNYYFILANSAAGNWRPVDDTNQTDYPVVYADIVGSPTPQQDYSFTVDENGNQILDIYKVRILLPDGVTWRTLKQINMDVITDGQLDTTVSGIPSEYYLTANGIFLVQQPNYNMTDGLELHINRTSTYFTVSDTTKKAGIPWVHHEYLALRPAYFYNLLKNPQLAKAQAEVLFGLDGRSGLQGAIKKYYRDRNKDFSQRITSEEVCSI